MYSPNRSLKLFALAALLAIAIQTNAQITCTPVFINEFQATIGNVEPHAIKALPDGTMLVAGKAFEGIILNGDVTPSDGYISKQAADGSILWSYLIGGVNDDYFSGITLLNDGGAMLYGATVPLGHTEKKGWLVRIDAAGAVIWSRVLGSPTTSNDEIKVVKQYTDGDIIGSININDHSAASDPVVFKIGLDQTMRWTHRFDNGDDDSYTSIAFSGDTVFAAGYYSAAGTKQAVISELKAADGSHLSSRNVYCADLSFREEISGLEIYNNTISYGLYVNRGTPTSANNNILLIQTDMQGNTKHSCYVLDNGGFSVLKPIRTKDSGFYLLRTDLGSYAGPSITKIDQYGTTVWGLEMDNSSISGLTMPSFDKTPDEGCILAGYYSTYLAGYHEISRIIKTTSWGEVGSCNIPQMAWSIDTLSYYEQPFTWASEPAFAPWYATLYDPAQSTPTTPFSTCQSSVCRDHTPIPAGCNKTYNILYGVDRSSILRDAVATQDGGRVAVGDLGYFTSTYLFASDGLVMKYNSNGDVAWTKNIAIPDHTIQLRRVLRMADGNLLVLGNEYYYGTMIMIKLDNSGNIIWSNFLNSGMVTEAIATPDNGFVVLSNNDEFGTGNVIRYDANANIIWKKQYTHVYDIPTYQSAFCSQDALFIGFHSATFADKFGIIRLDLATGNEVWTKGFSSGATSSSLNRIFALHDSVSIILYNFISGGATPYTSLLVKLDTLGNFSQAMTLGQDLLNTTPTYHFSDMDQALPTATLTPDQDFAIASRITIGAANYLSLSRFKPDGTVLWSRLFSNINTYLPYNIHPQGKGFIIAGSSDLIHTGNPDFTNGFVMKLDSSGQLQAGAADGCQATDRPFIIVPYKGVSSWYNPLSSVIDLPFIATPIAFNSHDVAIAPGLACYSPANCDAVTLQEKGKICSLNDTLVYFLANSSACGAAATWNYDPSYFKAGTISGDSIQLIALKGGSSVVDAQIEGYCSVTDQSKPVSVILSTSVPNLGPDTVVCTNVPIDLHAGAGYYSYVWNDNSTGEDLLVSAPGKFYVTTSDQCDHIHSDTVIVTSADSYFHLTGDTSRCNNDVVPLQASKGYTNYQWSPAYQIQAKDDQALVTPDVTTQYTVVAERRPGCMVTKSTWVTPKISPPINLGRDTSICTGDSLLLDAGPGFSSYQWSNGAMTQQIEIQQTGQYALSALYSNGCFSNDTIRLISLYQAVPPTLGKSPVLCGADGKLDAGPGYASYLWNDGSTNSFLTISRPGEYWVTVKDLHGCISSDSTNILLQAIPPSGFLPKDTTICQYGDLVIRTVEPFNSYAWSDLSSGPSLTVTSPGLYWVEVTDGNNCSGKDSIYVTQKNCLLGLFVPNAFTPDGDGHNDVFRPLLAGNTGHFDFMVFGRWGERVFETQTPAIGWDGKIKGTPAAAGAYVWVCRYQLDGQPEKVEKGTVILVR